MVKTNLFIGEKLEKKASPKIKTCWVHKDDFNRWYQDMGTKRLEKIDDLKDWVEVLKKEELKQFLSEKIETFEKKWIHRDYNTKPEMIGWDVRDWKQFKKDLMGD